MDEDHHPLLLIRNGVVLTSAEDKLIEVEKDVLIGGSEVTALLEPSASEQLLAVNGLNIYVVDASDCYVAPGLIDQHIHLTGGGGERGPASRTPEAQLSELVEGGLTTVVGLLGTDGVSRSMENLVTKARALEQEGLTAFIYTGNYHVPSPTVTSSISRDIMMIEQCIGVGELAVSDHRGSQLTAAEIAKVAAEARVGGMLAGKAGIVHVHMGSGEAALDPLFEVLEKTDIPITQFVPTHCSDRGEKLLTQAVEWMFRDGFIDFTADEDGHNATCEKINAIKTKNGLIAFMTMSSDAYGSFPVFDDRGKLLSYDVMSPSSLIKNVRKLVHNYGWTLAEALALVSTNPARVLKLFHRKGSIDVGKDADVIMLNKQSLAISVVVAGGKVMKDDSKRYLKRGMFERTPSS